MMPSNAVEVDAKATTFENVDRVAGSQKSGELWGVAAIELKRTLARKHQARFIGQRQRCVERNAYYYRCLYRLLRFIVEPRSRVLNVRCQMGQFLAALEPKRAVGVEISDEMVRLCRELHPDVECHRADPETFATDEKFDYVVVNDISDTVDVLAVLRQAQQMCHPHTRLVVYNYNYLWQPLLSLAGRLGIRTPLLEPNWFTEHDVTGLLNISGFELIKIHKSVLIPIWIPLLSEFVNRVVARLPGLRRLCLVQMIVARPRPVQLAAHEVSVSVIIPCKNERDNVQLAIERLPSMGRHVEIIFCDDRSTDGTGDEVRRLQSLYPEKDIRLVEGPGISKSENVWTGFRAARGDVLMILDGDLAVMPEELPYFFDALVSGQGEFINGSRLVYQMQRHAMKYSNYVGNWFFAHVFSFLLEQRIKDTLCGTKVLWRRDWLRIEPLLHSWGVTDRWGDFELLFGAARRHLRVVDLPVHYQERIHGITKMTRVVANGMRMLGMCIAALFNLKMQY
ncbi:MAG TPA: bifunctional class I SAM-dependent methyltransferase/glycosyltransferase family 2 protein [Pirellulales bacterium]|nr:bifunctional class I SAM-dependent methyltransferase/glycosyltransferase family 2 protein [Pirellulales bacterium]